jgi:hypothetical protein
MSAAAITSPFPIFSDRDGEPLDGGYIWIGLDNLPPQTNPTTVYWDEALTQPAAQPVRTRGGYPVNNGTPGRLFVTGGYNFLILDNAGRLIFSASGTTEVIIPNGTAAAPAFAPSSDLNSGMYFPAPDEIGFSVGGAETIRVSAGSAVIGSAFGQGQFICGGVGGVTFSGSFDNVPHIVRVNNVEVSRYTTAGLTIGAMSLQIASATFSTAPAIESTSANGVGISATAGPVQLATNGVIRQTVRLDGSIWTDNNTLPTFNCRAWVNFNGTGTVSIRGSGNVSSITDGRVGIYTINFTTSMPDVNYGLACTAMLDGSRVAATFNTTRAISNVLINPITAVNGSASWGSLDLTEVHVIVFR